MSEVAVIVHEIAIDGLPNMEALAGQVAFIFDGCIVSGWPLYPAGDFDYEDDEGVLWEANSDVGHSRRFGSVTHWVEFPVPLFALEGAGE